MFVLEHFKKRKRCPAVMMLIFWVLAICCPMQASFALTTISNDCPIVAANLSNNDFDIAIEGFGVAGNLLELYPEDAMIMALRNLQSACCKENALNGDVCRNTRSGVIPSLSLYNHLFDIGIKRLDGDPVYGDEEILDDQGKRWREYIRIEAVREQGSNPKRIQDNLVKARGKGNEGLPFLPTFDALDRCRDLDAEDFDTMRPKVMAQCDIAYCIYDEMKDANYGGKLAAWNYDLSRARAGYENCIDVVQDRVQREVVYTKAISMEQATSMVDYIRNAYSKIYFVGDRLGRLLRKFLDLQLFLEVVNRKVVEGTKQCNY